MFETPNAIKIERILLDHFKERGMKSMRNGKGEWLQLDARFLASAIQDEIELLHHGEITGGLTPWQERLTVTPWQASSP